MIRLGDRVKDTITEFAGIAMARTDWLNGCVRYGVQATGADAIKDGKPIDLYWIDEPQLIVLELNGGGESKPKHGPKDDPSCDCRNGG